MRPTQEAMTAVTVRPFCKPAEAITLDPAYERKRVVHDPLGGARHRPSPLTNQIRHADL